MNLRLEGHTFSDIFNQIGCIVHYSISAYNLSDSLPNFSNRLVISKSFFKLNFFAALSLATHFTQCGNYTH